MLALAPISEKEMTYSEAILYCTFCQHDDYTDWRLPDRAEWLDVIGITGWYDGRGSEWVSKWKVCPVRDV